MGLTVFDSDVQAWLSRCPQLIRPATDVSAPTPDRLVWHERSDDESCFVCGGSGLVHAHVLQRFADPAYDAVISAPVRCGRTRICGWERLRVHGKEEVAEVTGHRWAGRDELHAVPKHIADRWDKALRDEARALARRSPEERAEQLRQIRDSVALLKRRYAITPEQPDGHPDPDPRADAAPPPAAAHRGPETKRAQLPGRGDRRPEPVDRG